MDLGEILISTWKIIWKHKILWVFGILSGCGSVGNGSSNLRYIYEFPPSPAFNQWINHIPGWQVVLLVTGSLLLLLLIILLVVFLVTIGRIGLIRGAAKADRNGGKLTFGELFRGSLPYFWRVFALGLLVLLIVLMITFLVVLPLAITVVGLFCLIPLLCIAIPIAWFFAILLELTENAIVLENLGVFQGLERGWYIFRAHFGNILLMGLVLGFGVALIGGLVIALPFFVALLPSVAWAIRDPGSINQTGWLVTATCLVIYLPIAILLSGILQSYIRSAWTLTFLRLTVIRRAVDEPVSSPVQ